MILNITHTLDFSAIVFDFEHMFCYDVVTHRSVVFNKPL